MRISDWSSDVCSSDLLREHQASETKHARFRSLGRAWKCYEAVCGDEKRDKAGYKGAERPRLQPGSSSQTPSITIPAIKIGHTSCRDRVFSQCRSGWSRIHQIKKNKHIEIH